MFPTLFLPFAYFSFSLIQVVSFIRANGRVLFMGLDRRTSEDYDYVSLESKAKFDEDNEEVKRSLPNDMKGAFDVLVAQSEDLPVLPSNNDHVHQIFQTSFKQIIE